MKRDVWAALILFVSLGPLNAASPTTGTLVGVVRDSTGAPIPGVSIELSGSQLSSARLAVTESTGEFRFAFLEPAGDYKISASLVGFQTTLQPSIRVHLGRETSLSIVLRPLSEATVTVIGDQPLVSIRDTSTSTNITRELFQALPTRRDFQYLTVLAPGVVFDAEWDPLSPRLGGATHLENDYIIEGVSTRDPLLGGSATKVTMDFVREVQVMTGGFPAEYGRSTGGIINVVTESGTNAFKGSLLTYYEDSDWASAVPRRTIRGNTTYDLGRDRSDWGGSFGGPIVRDRAWFFLSYDQRQNTAQRRLRSDFYGIDRLEDVDSEEHVYAGKVTLGLTPHQSLTVSAFGNPSVESGWLYDTPTATPEFMLRDRRKGSTNASLRYDAIIGPVWTTEVTAGSHQQDLSELAATEAGRRVPTQADFSTRPVFYYGGYGNTGGQEARRDAIAVRASRNLDRHQLRFGADYEKNRYEDTFVFQQFTYYGRFDLGGDIGVADYMDHWTADFDGWGSNDLTAVFLQDQWQISPRVIASVGVRYEEQELGSGKGVTLAVGRAADGKLEREAASSVTLDGNWAPRVGIAWDPRGNGRSKLYASAGRFFEAIPVHMNVIHMNGYADRLDDYYSYVSNTGSSWVNPDGSPLNENWTLLGSATYGYAGGADTGPIAIDPDVGLQYQDEYSIGAEVRLGRSWVAGMRYVNRQLGDVIEDHHVFDEDGVAVDYVISNVGTSAFASDFRKPERKYEAIELTLQKYLTNGWQLMTSYVHSRARGDYDGLYNYINFNTGSGPHATFDIEKPAWQTNTYGRLRGDIPHQFKLHGSYTFPFGLTLSEGFMYSSGTPISAVMLGWPIGGVRMIYLLPRGSAGRTPDYYQLDLHADWRFPVGRSGVSMAVILDAYNVTEQDEALYVNEALVIRGEPGWQQWIKPDNLDENGIPKYNPDLPISPYYKEPRVYQPPRSFQLGVKLTF